MKFSSNCIRIIAGIVFILSQAGIFAQTKPQSVRPPEGKDFAPIQSLLASPILEGRETGERGSTIAAEYIASMMQHMGLKPFNRAGDANIVLSDYYQSFELLRCTTEESYIDVTQSNSPKAQLHFLIHSDFKVSNVTQHVSVAAAPVFAGYGIVAPEIGYDDYAGIDVKGRIVLIMEGYPGQHDSTSIAWKKFKTLAENDDFDLDKKCREAAKQGAIAVLTISKSYLAPESVNQKRKNVAPVVNLEYVGAEYILPANLKKETLASCFRLKKNSSEKLAMLIGVDFRKTEAQIAKQMKFNPFVIKNIISMKAKPTLDTLLVHNVIGKISGKDTTRTVILGAHYDHLGKRGKIIYCGSDDNASGTAGLLALAGKWTESKTIPPCNVVFASWTAEEKGLIGSEYFAGNLSSPEKVKLYINMDMISRSETSDSTQRKLSIGTRTADENLRELARKSNSTLDHPFNLDLWDVTGHSGSDYATFTAKNIPVMTYNTGLHNDYHTPRDISAIADLVKMGDVLRVVNESLQDFLESMIIK